MDAGEAKVDANLILFFGEKLRALLSETPSHKVKILSLSLSLSILLRWFCKLHKVHTRAYIASMNETVSKGVATGGKVSIFQQTDPLLCVRLETGEDQREAARSSEDKLNGRKNEDSQTTSEKSLRTRKFFSDNSGLPRP